MTQTKKKKDYKISTPVVLRSFLLTPNQSLFLSPPSLDFRIKLLKVVPIILFLCLSYLTFNYKYLGGGFNWYLNTMSISLPLFPVSDHRWSISYNLHWDPLCINAGKVMAPHSSTLAWRIPWTEEPGGLQTMGSLRVGHDWATSLSLFKFMHWRRKWQPTPVFLPGESQGPESLVGGCLWGHTESDTTEAT